MIATFCEPVRTPYTFDELADILNDGLASVLGQQPSTATLSVALAKVRLETGNGQFTYNWNLGNCKCPDNEPGQFTAIELNEVLGGKVVWFSPHGRLSGKGGVVVAEPWDSEPWHPQTRMRALAGPTDAGFFYVDFVAGRKRYAKAWQALLAGNAEAYAVELGRSGYYTAPIPVYAAQVVKLAQQSKAKLEGRPHEQIHVPEKWEWHELEANVTALRAEHVNDLFEMNQRDGHSEMAEEEADTLPPEAPDTEPPEVA